MMRDQFVIFFASFSVEGDTVWTGTTGADTSRSYDGAVATARDHLEGFQRREWVSRASIRVVRGSDGATVHDINWSRP